MFPVVIAKILIFPAICHCPSRSTCLYPNLCKPNQENFFITSDKSDIPKQIFAQTESKNTSNAELIHWREVSATIADPRKCNLTYVLVIIIFTGQSPRPPGLRCSSAALRLLGLLIWIPPGSWMSVSCDYCVLSDIGLCARLIPRPRSPSECGGRVIENDQVQQ